jgi:prolyl 4-hydroxylase
VFYIQQFLSDFEADSIVEIARPRINISYVGNYDAGGARVSSTRTSKNAWVSRQTSDITETLFLRAADLLNLDQAILVSTENAEDMQVVNYQLSQRYDSHHDWGVSGYL